LDELIHLLVVLTNLQWLDAATLDLLEDLLSQPDVHYLIFIDATKTKKSIPATC
jgi:predicted ATPase